jgi:hypothetical protein
MCVFKVRLVGCGSIFGLQPKFATAKDGLKGVSMTAPFDLFRRDSEGTFVWLEAATDLPTAKIRLRELSASAPGEYLLFDHSRAQIIERFRIQDVRPS